MKVIYLREWSSPKQIFLGFLGIIITSEFLEEVICHLWPGYEIWCSGLYRWWSFAFSGNLSIQPASVRAPPRSRLPLLYIDFSLKNLSPHRFLFFSVYPEVFIPDIKVTQLLLYLKIKSHLYLMSFLNKTNTFEDAWLWFASLPRFPSDLSPAANRLNSCAPGCNQAPLSLGMCQ